MKNKRLKGISNIKFLAVMLHNQKLSFVYKHVNQFPFFEKEKDCFIYNSLTY